MRHTGMRIAIALALGLSTLVATSFAADGGGGGGFWERMSGPGKWAFGYAYYSFCLTPGKRTHDGHCRVSERTAWLNLGGSFASTGSENREGELVSPALRALSFEPSVDWNPRLWERGPSLLVGAGVGFHRFWGEDVGFTRFSADARLTVFLFRHEGAWVGLRWTGRYFPQGFDAEDFGDPTGTFTTSGGDLVQAFSVVVNLGH
jgi:hypothetical protein